MIAENYRYTNIMRTVKKLISLGEIGRLNSVHVNFQRRHKIDNYHNNLKQPLLLDVAIHHIDLIRYLTGVEAQSVFARGWTPEWSWYGGISNVDMLLEMEENIRVSYCGNLSAFDNETGWHGAWRIEGEKGIIRILDDKVRINTRGAEFIVEINENNDSRKIVLEEFLCSLKENRKGETDIGDNLKTYAIIQAAIESIDINKDIFIKNIYD